MQVHCCGEPERGGGEGRGRVRGREEGEAYHTSPGRASSSCMETHTTGFLYEPNTTAENCQTEMNIIIILTMTSCEL